MYITRVTCGRILENMLILYVIKYLPEETLLNYVFLKNQWFIIGYKSKIICRPIYLINYSKIAALMYLITLNLKL